MEKVRGWEKGSYLGTKYEVIYAVIKSNKNNSSTTENCHQLAILIHSRNKKEALLKYIFTTLQGIKHMTWDMDSRS